MRGTAPWPTALTDRPNRVHEASALRSLFNVLKKERLVFANPMRGVTTGKNHAAVPIPFSDQEVDAVALAARQDPALRVVVALAGVHALPARRIRALQLDEVDLAGRRLDPDGFDRPLDDYTAEAIADYPAYRRRRWPNSTNPHLRIRLDSQRCQQHAAWLPRPRGAKMRDSDTGRPPSGCGNQAPPHTGAPHRGRPGHRKTTALLLLRAWHDGNT
ncbi:hypothetical protein AB0O82_24570 [Kitasatospora sp. NPDC088264]|uniref:hypothetical protein n=1 Tax=Kitasatospora sp. NPDC088264 TaxID=3155296 RepID=UPI00343F4BB5